MFHASQSLQKGILKEDRVRLRPRMMKKGEIETEKRQGKIKIKTERRQGEIEIETKRRQEEIVTERRQ